MSFHADRHARIVIVGGGAVGCSVAFHLAAKGERDVLLLEKAQLTHGSTWHAAGLVGQLRGKRNLTQLMRNSVAVLDRIEKETGQAIEWKKVGSLRLASSPERWSEIRRSMTLAQSFGFECHGLSPEEAYDLFPFIEKEGVVGAAYIPSDGYVDPYGLTQAYAAGAKAKGVRIEEGTRVTDIVSAGRRVVGVTTDKGSIACEILVNCAGIWAKRVAEMADVALAAGVVEHQYFLTEKKLSFDAGLTTLRDPDKNFYLKPDVGAFAIGGWEDGTKGCWRGRPPFDFARELFPANMDRLELFALPAAERLPILNEIGIQTIINGAIPVSADGEPIMGLAPERDNFFVACGFTAGIAASGGAGEAMANWIVDGDPGMDLWQFDVRRFGPPQAQGRWLEERAIEAYGAYYKIHWPAEEMHSARNARLSPVHDRLDAKGAVFGSRFGWERPNWIAPRGIERVDRPSFEEKPNWFGVVAKEHESIRERVAVIDQTSFAKFEVSGPGASSFLQSIADNDISGPVGSCTYTQLCNPRGGIEADVTLMRLTDDLYYGVTGSGFGIRDMGWIRKHMPADGSVHLSEVSSAFAVLNVVGPRARDVLQPLTDDDLSNAAFPYLTVREIELGLGTVRAARVGYVGELGWELHIPVEYAAALYDAIWEAGRAHGIADAGYRAIETCRLEKGYLYWSSDITPETNPYEAGLGFCVRLDKGNFLGRDALVRAKAEGPARRLVSFNLDGFAPFHGGETIFHDGKVVGSVTSAGFGHTLKKTIAFGYVPSALATESAFAISAFGKRYPVTRGPRCLYDPKGERLKA
jgi:glycine cleavage system aminomethyltransferase T/glycine/D-amino acid oxidase-like deaminating enzyme